MNAGTNLPPRNPQILQPDFPFGDILMLCGLLALVVGAAMIYRPAGVLVAGLEFLFVGHVLEMRGAKK